MDAREFADLRRFADQWACQKLHEKYWYGEAKRDVELICSVFTQDARYSTATGIAQIREKVAGYMAMMGPVLENYHIIPIAVNIEVDGDRAHGEIRGVGFVRIQDAEGGEKVLAVGIGYLDEFVRTPDGWRISAMRGIEGGFEVPHDTTWQFEADTKVKGLSILHD